eukprot:ANDGO_04834.mRNA.1 AP-1 complex subunit sigma-2
MIQFLVLVSRQGKVRLSKWYVPVVPSERPRILRDVCSLILSRTSKMCNMIEYRTDVKLVYKRYASLYFCVGIDPDDNELLALEILHQYVEVLDRYFGNVCELDLIFNFHKAYYMLDEIVLAGELQESSRRAVLKAVAYADQLTDQVLDGKSDA